MYPTSPDLVASANADAAAWLVAIVDNTTDAILSKTLDGIITSWNAGVERLFGFTREEAVGQPITLIIPDDRLHEEVDILTRLRRGERIERIERFETIRRRRDGSTVQIEVTISPVRNARGDVVGASKIARDIGERLRHADEQALLLREMQHRVRDHRNKVVAHTDLERIRLLLISEQIFEDISARLPFLDFDDGLWFYQDRWAWLEWTGILIRAAGERVFAVAQAAPSIALNRDYCPPANRQSSGGKV